MYLVFDIGGEKARGAFARPYELVLCEATKIAIRCTALVESKRGGYNTYVCI